MALPSPRAVPLLLTLYSPDGKIERLLYDANGDGRADMAVIYGPRATPDRSQIDTDLDGVVDRWEYFDARGQLAKVGRSRHHPGKPDAWEVHGTTGEVNRREYDEDGDGQVDRTEFVSGDHVFLEEVDTDADGTPDRRTAFRPDGTVLRTEIIRNGVWEKANSR